MSEPKRYFSEMREDEYGEFVRWHQYVVLQYENARLKAEVERLRKAGDAMAFIMSYEKDEEFDGFVEAWNAAKDGKDADQ